MSKENIASFGTILDRLENTTEESYLKRCNLYQTATAALLNGEELSDKDADRLLTICVHDINQDLRYTASALIIITKILEKVEAKKCSPAPHQLFKSAVAILQILEANATMSRYGKEILLYFETLLCYPNEILIEMACSHKDQVMKMFEIYLRKRFDCEDNKVLPVHFIIKLLKILPEKQKQAFVKDGFSVWFTKVVPILMTHSQSLKLSRTYMKELIVLLEILTESLVHVDYAEDNNWKYLIEYIYTPMKYPSILQNLLERGANFWDRIWIIFIRLLKHQITKVGNNNSTGSPINALLPVVEQAFKMDATNRCRAFKCWNVLIDNFSSEENEAYVMKRLKLLVIPLKANNTKVAETVHAKFDTWWHLITQFQNKMDKLYDMLLLPFLHYCFRNSMTVGKSVIIVTLIKQQSLEAFIEIVGHGECNCVSLPKLKTRLMNTRHLVERWNDWLCFLKTAIRNSADNDSELTTMQLTCLLKGFVGIIGELPENNVRRDLFNELLTLIAQLLEDPEVTLPYIIVRVLINTLFGDEKKIRLLLKTKDKVGPIYKVLTMILSPASKNFYTRKDSSEILSNFKLITNVILEQSINSPEHTIAWIFKTMPPKDVTLMLWTTLAESICESEYTLSQDTLYTVLLWPLNSMNLFTEGNSAMAAYTWYILYNLLHPILNTTHINREIAKTLQTNNEQMPSSTYFILLSSLALIKQKLLKDQNTDCEKEAEVLQKVITKLNEYQFVEKVFPLLVDTLVLLVNKVTESENVSLAEIIVISVNNLLKLTNHVLKQHIFDESKLIMHIDKLLKPVETLLYSDKYYNLELIIVDELIECWNVFSNESLKKKMLSILKTILSKSNEHETPFNIKIKDIVATVENKVGYLDTHAKATEDKVSGKVNFTTPDTKATPIRQSKKKEASIVNTVVENGEEFVVVKSNWKFNPRKLTENQKEKFKRKREDIPALYQDLSQSQDEFKLNAWKTDSQDTTTTNSKSSSKSTNEDFSTILKTIPNSDVVPTIMENILSDNNKNGHKNITVKTNEIMADNNSDQPEQPPPFKDAKLPRMALKDRVFKNVKILVERTGQAKANDLQGKDLNQTTNDILKTPPTKPNYTANIINSAPPNIAVERPLRIIKKPKKFADSEIFALKKRRRSNKSLDCEISDCDIKATNLETKSSDQNETFSRLVESPKIRVVSSKSDSQDVQCIKENKNSLMIKITAQNDANNSNVDTVQQCDNSLTADMKAIENSFEEQKQITSTTKVVSTPKDSVDIEQQITNITQVSSTPKFTTKKKEPDQPNSTVRNKRSRIEKQLLIDTVEGHPLLNGQSEKRATRKNILAVSERRKSVIEKLSKTKSDPKNDKKLKIKEKRSSSAESVQTSFLEKSSESTEDIPMSEDVIESSQDSTMTTISVKSSKNVLKKVPTDSSDKTNKHVQDIRAADTQCLLDNFNNDIENLSNTPSTNQESREDIELPKNKTMIDENATIDLTEDMDTESLDDKNGSDVIFIDGEKEPPILIKTENTDVEPDTLEIAEADTQPMETGTHISQIERNEKIGSIFTESENTSDVTSKDQTVVISLNSTDTQNDLINISGTTDVLVTENTESSSTCSPLKNDAQRKKDFLNNTIEISPIKTVSPETNKKSPSPETSAEYVVIKLTSPVQSNGEPFEKCDSPEIFTEDKVSPDKRLQSPPRTENSVNNTSPSSSLSLKKNRPQMRSNGRAAQMLVLCAPEKIQQACEQSTKSSPLNTPVRRNLKILYNSENENNDTEENEDSENFLKFKRSLPTADCSPAGPILKRKLADITDDATISPANKRKRVSFHDPPVSTTVAIQKYIAPSGIRSPQSFTSKRQEKQLRAHTPLKSAKRLDTVFKLDSVLTKTVESFTGEITAVTDDTEMSSLDQTPAVEVVKTSELNDTDPICSELMECNDPIENIAGELSSSAMKSLLIKELEGKIETIADLAKMTELEVNRLCIKAPKVKVAKKVLSDYAYKKAKEEAGVNNDVDIPTSNMCVTVPEPLRVDIEVQTNDVLINNSETQTICIPVSIACTQTDTLSITDTSAQTDETSTKDIITSCLADRPDFVEGLGDNLEETSIKQIAENLPLYAALDMIIKKMTASNAATVLERVLDRHSLLSTSTKDPSIDVLSCLQNYLCTRLDSKELILLCSQLLKKFHDQAP